MIHRTVRMLCAGAFAVTLAACDEAESPSNPADDDAAARTQHPGAKPADNTAHNKGDADAAAKTPLDQSESPEDIKVTADIRKAILGLDGMSTNADNVKVMTANGVVTVRGVVESQSEIDAITRIVTTTPGVTSSDVQLTVDPN